jgi:hypothetical protein
MRTLKPATLLSLVLTAFASVCLFAACAASEAEVVPPQINDPAHDPVLLHTDPMPISPFLYGQNVWYQPPAEVWPVIAEAHVKMVRIGGNAYNRSLPSNEDLTVWINLIRGIGAEVVLQVPFSWSPENAADLVTYFNVTTDTNIKYWSIGNEPDLNGEIGVQAVADYYKSLAPAMKAADPSILIMGPDTAWMNQAYLPSLFGGACDISGRDANGRWYVDGIVWHNYFIGSGPYTRENMLSKNASFENEVSGVLDLLSSADAKHGRTGDSRLKWAIGEFNVTYTNSPANGVDDFSCSGFAGGQLWANVFASGMKYGAEYMTPWSINEGGGNGSTGDLGFLGGDPKNNPSKRSTFYHEQMLAADFTGSYLASVSSIDNVRTIAASDGAKTAVMILNQDGNYGNDYTLRLDTDVIGTGDNLKIKVDAGIAVEYRDTAPAQSTTVLVFDSAGNLDKKLLYTIAEARAETGPVLY